MTVPATEPAPPSPRLSELLSRPRAFFEALGRLEPQTWRYVGLVVFTGLVSGIAAALSGRATVEAQSALAGAGMSAPATYGTLVFSGVFLMALTWLTLWFLGNLGAGAKGRAAEVYGATFLPQLLWAAALLVLGLFVHPEVTVAAPQLQGLDPSQTALAVQKYNQAVAAQVAQNPVIKVSNYLGYAVSLYQFWLAYQGFLVLTQDKRKALQGVAYPAALLAVLLLSLWLLNEAVGKMMGGA